MMFGLFGGDRILKAKNIIELMMNEVRKHSLKLSHSKVLKHKVGKTVVKEVRVSDVVIPNISHRLIMNEVVTLNDGNIYVVAGQTMFTNKIILQHICAGLVVESLVDATHVKSFNNISHTDDKYVSNDTIARLITNGFKGKKNFFIRRHFKISYFYID